MKHSSRCKSLLFTGLLARDLGGDALVSLLCDGETHSLAAREGNVSLRALANDEDVV